VVAASKRVIISLFVGLLICAGARADLILESPFDFEARPVGGAYTDLEAQVTDSTGPSNSLSMPELYPSRLLPEGQYDLGQPPQIPPRQIAADGGSSSLRLCLSALMSLGLCTSIHSAKKLSLGFIPPWYHTSGPCQIGHSIAVNPDSVCPVPVCCFVQPVQGATDITLQRHFGTVVSLWRKSQFTPDLLVARGPPVTC